MKLINTILTICTLLSLSACQDKEPVRPGEGITSFCFLMEQNPLLTEDVICTVNEDGTITGAFNDRLSSYKLIASFELDADCAMVYKIDQTSGVSKNDFSRDVVYEVKLHDGTIKTQTVKMVRKPEIGRAHV